MEGTNLLKDYGIFTGSEVTESNQDNTRVTNEDAQKKSCQGVRVRDD
jgi:hypothetical protein